MRYSSKLLEQAVSAFESLPGIGRKSALRLAMHILDENPDQVSNFSDQILSFRKNIKKCRVCNNISDNDVCEICCDASRHKGLVCVVESIRDVMAIEETGQFRGVYHVLGGVISPIEGIGPQDLNIDSLFSRIQDAQISEIIMAISPTIEGETTIFFISKRLSKYDVKISTIARGVAFGGELEYADEITLGRSIQARIPYHAYDTSLPSGMHG